MSQCGPAKQKEQPFFLNLHDTVDYVGIETCRSCHQDHYNTFIETGMGRSFGPASEQRSAADFEHAKPVYDPKNDMYYAPLKEKGTFKIMEFRLKGRDTVYKRTETITHIIGSGHHTNSHMWMDNGYLFQAPLTYYTQSGKWDLPPGFESVNTRFGRKIDLECMSCHNAMPSVAAGSINLFTRLPAGIDCERCHGPGELHVAEKRMGHIVDVKKEADRTIVNPAKLPWKLQVDVCQRCHLQGNNVLKPGKQFTDFRPGMHLDSVFEIYMPATAGKEDFVMAGHADRLQMSACFKKSNTGNTETYNPGLNLTCISCHNPHISVRKTNVAGFNNTCVQCHSNTGKSTLKKCTAPAAELANALNNCVKCHMPASDTRDIPHVTVHDHYIRKPLKTAIPQTVKPTGTLYAVNNPNPSDAMHFKALVTWYEKFKPDETYMHNAGKMLNTVKEIPLLIHYYYAHHEYGKVVQLSSGSEVQSSDAWTCYRIAKALDQTGNTPKAQPWYQAASEKMPLNADFTVEYANALIRLKKPAQALTILQPLTEAQPKYELARVNMGAAYSLLGDNAPALKNLLTALALNPDNENTCLYLAELYLKENKTGLAGKYLKEALRINPANATAKQMLGKMIVSD
ncbi:MAG: tetratricopeptide repeat protein [Bacteroidetes bacterium]|nr:tetratricopeptide repeat protein [Bacteroidota bacterium]